MEDADNGGSRCHAAWEKSIKALRLGRRGKQEHDHVTLLFLATHDHDRLRGKKTERLRIGRGKKTHFFLLFLATHDTRLSEKGKKK